MTQEKLIRLFQEISLHNNEVAFKQLFYYSYPGLLSFAKSIIGDIHKAEEVVNDVFVKLWENRNLLTAVTNPSHYLYTSVRHACINFIGSKANKANTQVAFLGATEESFSWSLTDNEAAIINKQLLGIVDREINRLPPQCRLIFRLIRFEGLKYQEVAQLLALSLKTVENQMGIAVKKLFAALRAAYPDEDFLDKVKNK
ncbi:MAG: RNA polymerase sigma-70 factor [Niabella sp.]